MQANDFAKLLEDTEVEIVERGSRVGILGMTSVTAALVRQLSGAGLRTAIRGVFAPKHVESLEFTVEVRALEELLDEELDALVVASDEDKETLIEAALPYIGGAPKLIVAGYGHLAFRDEVFRDLEANLLVPSIANGYPNCLVHIYQCLANAARLGLEGSVVEFGTFKGGTAAFLGSAVRRLKTKWPVVSFDTFTGFPPRRSPLDMYDQPNCVFTDVEAVRNYTGRLGVKLVEGDIVDTAKQLQDTDIVLTFVDTDNYSSARAALDVVIDRTVVGGAIIFDHFTGVDRFRYTLGERFAAKRVLDDSRYFNLHGTGVFTRQC